MLNIAVDTERDPVAYWKQNGYDWALGLDVDGATTYKVTGIPTTLFIDRQGNLTKIEGYGGEEQWNAELSRILGSAA